MEHDNTKYVGYLYLFFQRVNLDYFGNLDPTFVNHFGFKIQRAHGLAWEPGNFAAYVNIFIFLNLFIFKNIRKVVLGFLAIALAWSTAGFFTLAIQLIFYTILNFKNLKIKFLIPKLIVASFILYFLVPAFIANANEKIYGDKSVSGASRFVNTLISINTIRNNPIIGTGFYFEKYAKELDKSLSFAKNETGSFIKSASRINKTASTNSFLRLYAQMGIFIGLVLTVAIFKQTLVKQNKVVFGLILITSLSSAPLLFFPFFFLFISSGLLNMFGIKSSLN
jgi:hypothetical protein